MCIIYTVVNKFNSVFFNPITILITIQNEFKWFITIEVSGNQLIYNL